MGYWWLLSWHQNVLRPFVCPLPECWLQKWIVCVKIGPIVCPLELLSLPVAKDSPLVLIHILYCVLLMLLCEPTTLPTRTSLVMLSWERVSRSADGWTRLVMTLLYGRSGRDPTCHSQATFLHPDDLLHPIELSSYMYVRYIWIPITNCKNRPMSWVLNSPDPEGISWSWSSAEPEMCTLIVVDFNLCADFLYVVHLLQHLQCQSWVNKNRTSALSAFMYGQVRKFYIQNVGPPCWCQRQEVHRLYVLDSNMNNGFSAFITFSCYQGNVR